jgi:predicted membrane protein
MEKAWMPNVAGILNIVAGFQILGTASLALVATIIVAWYHSTFVGDSPSSNTAIMTLLLFTVSALAIISGIFALRRRNWTLVLVGPILMCIIPPLIGSRVLEEGTISVHGFIMLAVVPSLMGIAAIVFTALSKNEFE